MFNSLVYWTSFDFFYINFFLSVQMKLDKPVSRRTSTREIVKMYLQRKAAMKKWFEANKQRVSLTTDIWEAKITRKHFES